MKTIKIQVDRLALEGDGVGRAAGNPDLNGKVAFVPYSLPGELVEARLLANKKNFTRWLPTFIHRASPSRAKPRCPVHFHAGTAENWCGGCDWQHMTTNFQRESKTQLLKETLLRIGNAGNFLLNPVLFGSQDWRYRNKVQVPFGRSGRAVVAGFFSPGTHRIVEFEDCPIQPEESVQIVQTVKKLALALDLLPYDEDRHRGWLRHLLVRTNEAHQAILALVVTDSRFPQKKPFLEELRRTCPFVTGVFLNIQPAKTHVILGREWIHLWGADRLEERISGLSLSYSPGSFFQVNTKTAELLYQEAVSRLEPSENSVVLDLYCGVGAMTLLAAKTGKFAIGLEESPSSIKDAERNARDNRIANVKFIEGQVERLLKDPHSIWSDYLRSEELSVLVDPPRTGCEESVLRGLIRLHPRRIVYVSCHPATLARDIRLLSTHYRLTSVTPVDLFPQTSHIEAVARLDRI